MYKRPSQPETLAPLSHSFPDQPLPPLFSFSDPAPAPPLRLRSITVLASPHCALAPPRLFVRWRLRAAAPCGGSQCGAVRGARASLRRGIVRVTAGRRPLHLVHLAPPPRPPALPRVALCRRPCCCSWPRGRAPLVPAQVAPDSAPRALRRGAPGGALLRDGSHCIPSF